MIDKNDIDLNFDYFDTQDFHKLPKRKWNSTVFSILHANICYLQENSENSDILISILDYKFSVNAVFESWNPSKKDKIPEIAKYQPFYWTRGA